MDAQAVQRVEPIAAIALVVAAVVLLVIVVATGASFDGAELLGLIGLATGGVLALDAWRRSVERTRRLEAALGMAHAEAARDAAEREDTLRAAQRELEALADRAGQQAERDRAERERLQRALRRAEETGAQQRVLLRRLEQSRRAEREWNHELRAQLQDMYESSRRLADDDVRALVLRAAIQLVEAEKGILLSREDADRDGALDVVISHGFEHDPRDSALAQRFAHEVVALDEIVREDTPTNDVDARSPADREIDTLVAVPMYMHDRFHGVIICANRPGGFEDIDDNVLLALGDQAGAALHHGQLRNQVRDAHHGAVRALVEAMSARDPARHRETTHLTAQALTLARDLSLDDWQRDVLICATLLRNVGYLALPEPVLTLGRPLQPNERATIELHPRLGFNIIAQVPALRDVATTTLYHHERLDGAGYPRGLGEEQIGLATRVLTVCDVFDALVSNRVYRPAWTRERALCLLREESGTAFDPVCVAALERVLARDEDELGWVASLAEPARVPAPRR
jgi:HD-GYP domain-containing protein (c-di-GMP phosphodiesterase class II)